MTNTSYRKMITTSAFISNVEIYDICTLLWDDHNKLINSITLP